MDNKYLKNYYMIKRPWTMKVAKAGGGGMNAQARKFAKIMSITMLLNLMAALAFIAFIFIEVIK
ncbi:MAG: hypothetical protein M1559_00170 [Candidatus Marsarchaeota archaeon]|jgi:hypothetical protein|nr:hypothetical protein [Candidatus Marsarchaeota archaeon]